MKQAAAQRPGYSGIPEDDTASLRQSPRLRRPKGYYFLTPVWGEAYTRVFLDITVPSLLAPGNLPAFSDEPDSRFIVFTTLQDAQAIRSAPVFERLSEVIRVDIEYILMPGTNYPFGVDAKYDLMSECHKRGLAVADAVDAAILFLSPDLVFADGSLATVKRLAEEGKDLILVTGIRTIKQTVPHALKKYAGHDHSLTVSSRELMQIALDNLHPLAQASWWEEGPDDNLIPANLYWRAGNEGLVARCFHLHTILIHPQRKNALFFSTIDDDLIVSACPDTSHHHIITDSDDFLIIEMTDRERMFSMRCHKGSVKETADWAEFGVNDHHRAFVNATIRMHTGKTDEKAWKEAGHRSDATVAALRKRLSRPAWRLLAFAPHALMMRCIRISRYYELLRANAMLQENVLPGLSRSPGHVQLMMKYANLLIKIPARLLAFYSRLAYRTGVAQWRVKQRVYGIPWRPRPWIFQHRYIRQTARDMANTVELCTGTPLVISHNDAISVTAHCHPTVRFGIFAVESQGNVTILDKETSAPAKSASCDTVAIERALPANAPLEAVTREVARILKPGGRLVLYLYRLPSRGEYVGQEVCLSVEAANSLLAADFTVATQLTQGSRAQTLLFRVLDRIKWQARRRIPFVARACLFFMALPVTLALALAVNIAMPLSGPASKRHYISSITLAHKKAGTP